MILVLVFSLALSLGLLAPALLSFAATTDRFDLNRYLALHSFLVLQVHILRRDCVHTTRQHPSEQSDGVLRRGPRRQSAARAARQVALCGAHQSPPTEVSRTWMSTASFASLPTKANPSSTSPSIASLIADTICSDNINKYLGCNGLLGARLGKGKIIVNESATSVSTMSQSTSSCLPMTTNPNCDGPRPLRSSAKK